LYALLSATDRAHPAARATFERLLSADETLLAHNYVLLETTALLQRRLGLDAVGALRDALAPALSVVWIDRELHAQALAATLAAGDPTISLVDRVSFELMRRRRVSRAFAFDEHFAEQGFELL